MKLIIKFYLVLHNWNIFLWALVYIFLYLIGNWSWCYSVQATIKSSQDFTKFKKKNNQSTKKLKLLDFLLDFVVIPLVKKHNTVLLESTD